MVDAASDARSRRRALLRRLREPALLAVTLTALLAGGIAWLAGARERSDACWIAGTVVAIVPATWWVVERPSSPPCRRRSHRRALARRHASRGGVSGGRTDRRDAGDRPGPRRGRGTTRHQGPALAARPCATDRATPGRRHRRDRPARSRRCRRRPRRRSRRGGAVDGWVTSEVAVLDESVLTGEPLAVQRRRGEAIRSGTVDAGGAFEMQARTTADLSTYAGIVRLAQDAAAESAPVVRVADRIAGWFLPVALAVAGAAWLLSGSATRAVAVLVVATPAHCCWPRPSRSCRVCPRLAPRRRGP